MAANYKLELVGVLGFPVAENPTCVMLDAAFAALDLPWRYLTIEVEPPALPDAICDVVPNPPETRLIRTARGRGLKTLTGLPMLVYQGAIGFRMWTGRAAPESVMRAALEKVFGGTEVSGEGG